MFATLLRQRAVCSNRLPPFPAISPLPPRADSSASLLMKKKDDRRRLPLSLLTYLPSLLSSAFLRRRARLRDILRHQNPSGGPPQHRQSSSDDGTVRACRRWTDGARLSEPRSL